ncbi:hypothetical protein PHYPSEUDO_004850 [Phytophthora pseudosyringae]|uniref:Retrotransposon Copia-like N-terminal domain-containing protein n=1 Tax=Phytophthora pseudosyringae TaxID=221518 RepID=A0A8T1VQZ9_9STRA|nr:hypothetical protein PHYPSEUDO_004850 [Phytophthora pseudosyringae]
MVGRYVSAWQSPHAPLESLSLLTFNLNLAFTSILSSIFLPRRSPTSYLCPVYHDASTGFEPNVGENRRRLPSPDFPVWNARIRAALVGQGLLGFIDQEDYDGDSNSSADNSDGYER